MVGDLLQCNEVRVRIFLFICATFSFKISLPRLIYLPHPHSQHCYYLEVSTQQLHQLQCGSYNVYGLLGGHRPRGSTGRRPVRKKRPAKRVFFFWFPLRFCDASSRSGLTDFSPTVISSIRLINYEHAAKWRRAHSPGLQVTAPGAGQYVIRFRSPGCFSAEKGAQRSVHQNFKV